ncbi:type II toxin-antitoxin system RelE/ParE family toxin [Paenibacillus sp. P96]|uniref:Type II toxin-antitoxin system RelE/ParE family toxin n=1 Tax=Paenibacillus zeirhizosphaerae TaxID=2987519 RepID=A0ABT9FN65_9BACL|nr:type II toxin-antitoxin system RelE/ParE family toxin [Paenibacillus sp. P96]MDP4096171.1 type II toxin-antitoxin system RelE/ParE family toxin [Paenibacillus sp. P96]
MLPVTYLAPAKKYFKKLVEKPLKKRYLDAIDAIRMDPYIGEQKTGDLTGVYGYDVSYQGTNYEIAYRVEENDDGELVVVILAGSRENFYEELKRYTK